MKKTLLALGLALPLVAAAAPEEDGADFLRFMQRPESREVAMAYVDAARLEWNGTLFCIEGADPQRQAFEAVKHYLETHPDELYRPRRYLIIQGLRAGHPCQR
jgi:hypothetical protein